MPSSQAGKVGRYRLLILDGHGSHLHLNLTGSVVKHILLHSACPQVHYTFYSRLILAFLDP
jgi:hypothetical protein